MGDSHTPLKKGLHGAPTKNIMKRVALVTLPSSYSFIKVLMLVKTLKFNQILKVSG